MEDSLLRPREIVWEDGHHYIIDRVSDVSPAASRKVGGQGDRYTVFIEGRQKYLFFERSANIEENNIGRWFM